MSKENVRETTVLSSWSEYWGRVWTMSAGPWDTNQNERELDLGADSVRDQRAYPVGLP